MQPHFNFHYDCDGGWHISTFILIVTAAWAAAFQIFILIVTAAGAAAFQFFILIVTAAGFAAFQFP